MEVQNGHGNRNVNHHSKLLDLANLRTQSTGV
jgi:hypothetical protein